MNLLDFGAELDEIHKLPDGAVVFKAANRSRFDYHISINDKYYYQYHRNNGVAKLGVKIDDTTMYLFRTIEGLISFADLLNVAYMRTMFPKLFVMTGVNYLPMKLTQNARIERLIHFAGTGIFPLCMSLLLPVFIYAIVYEKEQKVLEIMKMNGMKMRYYWAVNFLFDMLIYACTFGVFFVYGGLILKIDAFLHTSAAFQFIMFFGWGYAQIALAFLVSPFLSRAQSATSTFRSCDFACSCRLCGVAVANRDRNHPEQHDVRLPERDAIYAYVYPAVQLLSHLLPSLPRLRFRYLLLQPGCAGRRSVGLPEGAVSVLHFLPPPRPLPARGRSSGVRRVPASSVPPGLDQATVRWKAEKEKGRRSGRNKSQAGGAENQRGRGGRRLHG